MLTTRFTRLVGCAVPIQQAGMGAAAPPELVAAVSEAGAFGMLGTARAGLNAKTFAGLLERTRQLTTRPFGVNFIMRPGSVAAASPREFIEQAAKVGQVVEFFYTDPSTEFVRIVHDHGALVSWQVGSREEALAAADIGCDLIVAQGIEAGGHVRGTIGVLSLLAEVLDAVPLVPVLAAGGVGTGRAMAAALAAGADGVRVGTRFVASEEAGVHPTYAKALVAARAQDTVYTRTFHVGWPEAPHRVLRSAIDAAEAFRGEIVGTIVGLDGTESAVPRFGTRVPDSTATGEVAAMSLYAGESVEGVKGVLPAGEIVRELVEQAEQLLGGVSGRRIDVFFYGLFMDIDLLRESGIAPVNPRRAYVDGFALCIGRRATLIPSAGARAYGMLFALTPTELEQLYSAPGLEHYRPEALIAQPLEGTAVPAVCYTLRQAPPAHERNPEYAARLQRALSKLGFPQEYVGSLS